MISTEQIKELRDKTGISISQCKQALEEASGDQAKALVILKERGAQIADKKSGRSLKAGVVASYVHSTRTMGALIVLSCETDFVAKSPEFISVAEDIAMQAAAMEPADIAELMAQPFIKDASQTIADLVNGLVQKFGERTEIIKFVRLDTSAV
jgi:elongation factor Ts